MSILDLKKASVFKNKLLTTEQKKLVTRNLKFEGFAAAHHESKIKNKANVKYLSEMEMWHGDAWATVMDESGESEKNINLDKAISEGAILLTNNLLIYYPNRENHVSAVEIVTTAEWWDDTYICINNCGPAEKLERWNEFLEGLKNTFDIKLSDKILLYEGASKESLRNLSSDIEKLEDEVIDFKAATNEITETIVNENIKILTKLDNLKNKVLDFSNQLSNSRDFVKDFEKFKKTSIEQIEKIKALGSLGRIRELTSSKKSIFDMKMSGLVQSFSEVITGFFLEGKANEKLFADVSKTNIKRHDCQAEKEIHLNERSTLRHAQKMELDLINEDLKNEARVIKGSKSDSALQASLLGETHKDHNVLLFSLLGGLVCLGIGAIYYIYQENVFMEDLEELFYSIIGSILMMIVGGIAFETGWGILLAIVGAFFFIFTIWESAFALSALAILGIFSLGFILLVTKWDNIEYSLRKGNIDKINKKITNLKSTINDQIQTITKKAQTKKTRIKTNFQNDLIDLSYLSNETIDYLKTIFKNLDVAEGFDYAAFKKEGKALSKTLSSAEKNDEKNAQLLQDAIALQLKNEITLADFQHDSRKGPDNFDDLLKKYEGLLDELYTQANSVETIIEDTEQNLDSLGKIADQLNGLNLKEAKG